MLKIFKRLPVLQSLIAVGFLIIQIICALYLPKATADIVNVGVRASNISYIWSKGYQMIALSGFGLLCGLCNVYLFSQISYKLGGELRFDIYRKVLSFSKNEFDKMGTATLITRNTNDVTQVQTLVEGVLKYFILAPAMLIGGIVMTWFLNPRLALVFLCTVPILGSAYIVIYRYANPLYTVMQKLLDTLNLLFRESLTGVRVIRAFNEESQGYEKYKTVNQEYTRNYMKAGTIMSLSVPLVTMLTSLATVLVVWIGGKGVINGTVEIGSIMAAISYSVQILMGFGMLTNVILAIPRGQISAKRIYEVIDMPISVVDPDRASSPEGTRLAFEHVDFRYQSAGKKTLEDISFSVPQGQTLAIIGSTGDGKSSLVNLISRLYDVENGFISIGGMNIRNMKQQKLRELVSFTPQKSTLFFGTIRSNLLKGNSTASDEEIWAVLNVAQAAEFVNTLPSGLDSVVEKGGGNFSGGQKQRLCIARTLLKNALIYIFDDSFSALDFKTDAAVREAMDYKLKSAITIIVAQRISTIKNADLILVLNHGKIAGVGNHDTLKETNLIYQEIIDSQYYREEKTI